ncbi:hypothetical protein CHUAL_001999 [Chamberlinius hualienensis]
MHPFYQPGDKNKPVNMPNIYGYGYRQPLPPPPQGGNFMIPNAYYPAVQSGVYRSNFNVVQVSNASGVYDASSGFVRSNQPVTVDDPRQQKAMMEKMLKERNYQLQQQKLREFNPSHGSKLQADKLIENVIGKLGTDSLTVGKELSDKKQTFIDTSSKPVTLGAPGLPAFSSVAKCGQKARDWSNLEDLSDVFSLSTSEFSSDLPLWCREGSTTVPAAYLEVERCVTRDGKLDTGLVYQVLLSSGLSKETLGRLWALANRETPGVLSKSELYSVLAMIALVQCACEVYSISVLNSVAQPPIPRFNVVNNFKMSNVGITQNETQLQPTQPLSQQTDSNLNSVDDFDDFQSAPPIETSSVTPSIPESIISLNVGSRLANYDLNRTHEPILLLKPKSDRSEVVHLEIVSSEEPKLDLMESVEDKYSIFRTIDSTQPSKDSGNFNSFSSNVETKSDLKSIEENISNLNLVDDFDDFQWHTPLPSTQPSLLPMPSLQPLAFNQPSESVLVSNYNAIEFEDDDDEFGDFAGAETVASIDLGSGNGGLLVSGYHVPSPLQSEVQSVASLDLGVVDTRSETPPVVNNTDTGLKADTNSVDSLNLTLTDRYSFLKRETERSASHENSHAYEWKRCLDSCYQLIKNTLEVFNSGSSSGVCHEVINCEEGENYIKSLIEVYRVACRISRWIQSVQGEDFQVLETTVSNIDDEWNRLLPFIISSPVVVMSFIN